MKLITFSPTGTTSRVVEEIARGMGRDSLERIDLATPAADSAEYPVLSGGVAVIGAPVYYGRVPAVAARRLRRLRAEGTAAVLVAVYGNRHHGDALRELRDIAVEAGFEPVAAAAFVGEHSFSTASRPIARGRPDKGDIDLAFGFGREIARKLAAADDPAGRPRLEVPGDFPYREIPPRPDAMPYSLESACNRCGSCAEVCPTAAITIGETVETDAGACILCCACVKSCPNGGRALEREWSEKIGLWLAENCAERREPLTIL